MAHMKAELLSELGWEVDNGSGTVTVPLGDDTIPWAAEEPSFTSAREAMTFINQKSPMIPLEVASRLISGAARHAKEFLKWGSVSTARSRKAYQDGARDMYPPILKVAVVPPGSAWYTQKQSDNGLARLLEGRDFFSDRSLLEMLMAVEEGSRTMPALTAEQAREAFQVSAFIPLLDYELGYWPQEWSINTHPHAQYQDGFPEIDELQIQTRPEGNQDGINRWHSKRAFFRALLAVVDSRGMGRMPVGDITGHESTHALWLKVMSPRHGWTWCYGADGSPLFVRPGCQVETGVAGVDYFTSMEAVRAFLVGCASRGDKPTATRPPKSPGFKATAPAKPPSAATSTTSSTAPLRGPTASSSSRRHEQPFNEAPPSPQRAFQPGGLDCTTGEVTITMSDEWDDVWPKLQKLKWGLEQPHSRGHQGRQSNRYYFPGCHTRGDEAVEGMHYLASEQAVLQWIRANYKLLPSQVTTTSSAPEPMDVCQPQGNAKRKGRASSSSKVATVSTANTDDDDEMPAVADQEEEEEDQRATKALKKSKGGDTETAVAEQQPPPVSRQTRSFFPVRAPNGYEDNETYDLVDGDRTSLWRTLKKEYGWDWTSGGELDSYVYVRRKREKGETKKTWRHGIDYFRTEAEVYDYVAARKRNAPLPNYDAEGGSRREKVAGEHHTRQRLQQRQSAAATVINDEKAAAAAPAERKRVSSSSSSSSRGKARRQSRMSQEMAAEKSGCEEASSSEEEEEEDKEVPLFTDKGRPLRRSLIKKELPEEGAKKKTKKTKFPGEPPEDDYHTRTVLARGINLWQTGNWVWLELKKFLKWRVEKAPFALRLESGCQYIPAGGSKDGVEGKDWFASVDDISAYARDVVCKGERLRHMDGESDDEDDEEGEEEEEDGHADGADDDEDDGGSDEGEDDDDEDNDDEEEEEEPIDHKKDSEAMVIRKAVRQHGLTKVTVGGTEYLLAPGVVAKSQKAIDKLRSGKDYLLANRKSVCQWLVEQAMNGGQDEEQGVVAKRSEADISPEDFKDHQLLLKKLRTYHGWRTVKAPGLKTWVHVPPGGNAKGTEGVDYCATKEQVEELVWKMIDGDRGCELSQESVPMETTALPSFNRKPSFATSAERGDEEDDDDDDDEDTVEENNEEMQEGDGDDEDGEDAMQVDVAEAETDEDQEKTARMDKQDVTLLDEEEDREDNSEMQVDKQDEYDRRPYDKEYLLCQLDGREQGAISNFNNSLRLVHKWRIIAAADVLVPRTADHDTTYFYVLPNRKLPGKGGKEGRDWVANWDMLRDFIEKGYGLLPERGAGADEIRYPTEDDIPILSPAASERSTRSTRRSLSSRQSISGSPNMSEGERSSRKADLSSADRASRSRGGQAAAPSSSSSNRKYHSCSTSLEEEDEEEEEEEEEVPSSQESHQGDSATTTSGSKSSLGKKPRRGCASPAVPSETGGAVLVTPGSAASAGSSRCSRRTVGTTKVITPAPSPPKLSSDQRVRYTAAVLRAKGYDLKAVGTHYTKYHLVPPPSSEGEEAEEPEEFQSREEALRFARENGLVTEGELVQLYEKDAWRPLIDRLRAIADKFGQSRYTSVRAEETHEVTDFLLSKLKVPTGGLIHLCGLPGTGKTEVAKAAIRAIAKELDGLGLKEVPRHAIMSCSAFVKEPMRLFETAYKELNNVGHQHIDDDDSDSRSQLDKQNHEMATTYFKKTVKKGWVRGMDKALKDRTVIDEDDRSKCDSMMGIMKVVVLDEFDLLLKSASGRKVVSDLCSYSLTPNSTLLLIAISNTVTNRIDECLELTAEQRAEIHPAVVFGGFKEEELMSILKQESQGAIAEVGLKKLTKTVASKAGDARRAIGYAKDAINAHLKVLEEKAGAEGAQDVTPAELEKYAQVPMSIIMNVSKEDAEAVSTLKEMPLFQRLLLAVLLYEGKDGHTVKCHDLKSHFSDALDKRVAAKCGNNVFEDSMQGLIHHGLASVHHKVGGGNAQQVHDQASVTCTIGVEDYLRNVPTNDDQLFHEYVASIRKSLKMQEEGNKDY